VNGQWFQTLYANLHVCGIQNGQAKIINFKLVFINFFYEWSMACCWGRAGPIGAGSGPRAGVSCVKLYT